MDTEIKKIMADLGLRYDQAYRMVRQRAEFNRRGMVRSINWLK
jgi:hypothetical protein